ncbi:hypothetical protein DBR32_09850 [Taibaiella sp. KBW10]|uniref:porin family protein n=1 Tax=Taibaiella sp. KBW10 TaxID=2153357 RepID=UPI000F5AE95A|nr:porin family protein [Taibaiella sp. KBW10]RQO31001.1 hypothetical protein DBR32_09850 [Taibaiella sp. KBW10]
MKKVILSIATLAGFAVATQAQVKFAPEVGLNVTTMKSSSDLATSTSNALVGLRAGAYVELPFNNMISLEPGVFYSMKGGENTFLGVKSTTTLSYIEVPVNIKFNLPLGIAGKVFAYAGPHIAYAVAGQTKIGSVSSDIKFGDGNAQMNPLDIGAQVGVGYQLPFGLYARAQYGMGFNNLSNASTMNTKLTNNSNFGISVGFQF